MVNSFLGNVLCYRHTGQVIVSRVHHEEVAVRFQTPVSRCFIIIIRVFLKIYHGQHTWVFYNIILFIILRSSFVSCQYDSFMGPSTLRSSFVFARIFRLCAISLCDFHLFPVFHLRSWVFLRWNLIFSCLWFSSMCNFIRNET